VLDPVLSIEAGAASAIERGVPAIVAGVVTDGRPSWTGTFGSIERDAVVRVGSITKVFTAVAVMQLVERGRIDLDDPVSRHLTSYAFKPAWGHRPATVREVLTHTGGFGEFRRLREWRWKTIPFAVDDGERIPPLSEFYADGLRASTGPGRGYAYANHAFATLGQLVEDVSGVPYDEAILRNILEPLGMSSSHILLTDELRARLAQGYHVTPEGPVEVPLQHIVIAPAGSLHSTVDDMLRFVAWVATTGESTPEVLERDTLALMFERHFEPDVRLPGQGLGFARDDIAGEPVVGHDGGFPGFVSSFAAVPGRGFGAFATATAIDLAPKQLVNAAIDAVLEPAPVTYGSLPAGYEHHAGLYAPTLGLSADSRWWNEYGGEFTIRADADGLVLESPRGPHAEGTRLRPVGDDLWHGTANRMGSTQSIRVRFWPDGRGFDGSIPQVARMRKRPVVRSRRIYLPAAKYGGPGVAVSAVVAGLAVWWRRRSSP
jgi:CubicO group peptidase (beta-lactamase class C family)